MPLAILTALTVFRLAFRQTKGLIGSIIGLLGLTLRVPDHTTLSRRAATLEVPRPQRHPGSSDAAPMHLLVGSTGLKLCGEGEWLVEKHGIKTRRAWRKLHLGVDADSGQIMAAALTAKEVDDGVQVGPLQMWRRRAALALKDMGILDQISGRPSSLFGQRHQPADPCNNAARVSLSFHAHGLVQHSMDAAAGYTSLRTLDFSAYKPPL